MWKMHRLMEPEEGGVPVVSGGNSTPAPSPSPSPSPSSTAAPAASSASNDSSSGGSSTPADEFDFGALADYHASGGVETPPVVETPAVPPATSAPQTPAVAAPPAATTPPPATTTPPPVEQPAQPATATTQTPASEPANQPPQQVNWEEHRATFLPKLQEMYKLSDQEVQDFQTNPGEAIPKLAAELHYKVMMSLHSSMMELLPHAIESQSRLTQKKVEYENKFYGKFPALKEAVAKDIKVEATINEAIKAFRVANPKATMDDLINKVGLLTMITLGLDPMQSQGQPAPVATPAPVSMQPSQIPGRPAGMTAAAHVPVRQHAAAPGEQSDEQLYADIANWHLGGG